MTVFRRFLKDRRRGMIGWTLSVFLFFLLQNAFYPSFKDQPDLTALFDDLPDSFKGLLGISDAVPLTSPPGWVQGQVFSILPVLVIVYAISQGVRALVATEEDGTLELLLSNPIARGRVALERYGAFLALVFVVAIGSCALTLVTLPVLQLTEGVSLPGYAAASFAAVALGWLFGSLAFGIGAATGRRSLALSIAAAVTIGTYTANGLAGSVEAAHPLRFISPFHWFLGRNMLAQGIAWEALTLPLAVSAVLAAWGIWGFRRRDLH